MKSIHDHILEAFYKRKYIESVENNEKGKHEQQKGGKPISKHVKIGQMPYSQTIGKVDDRNLTGVGNMGETMCKYKNAYKVHKFLEKCPLIATKEGEDGIA